VIGFKTFLLEQVGEQPKVLKHLEHLEDAVLRGSQGHKDASTALWSTYDRLTKKKRSVRSQIKIKKDGAPSVLFGIHPDTKKFFVATKSAFNVTPKINYTPADIMRNHGHSPGLAEKLNTALTHLSKVVKTGVYQGDLMWDKKSVRDEGNTWSFQPNTIKYSIDKNSTSGKKISKAQLGIALHTSYSGKTGSALSMDSVPSFKGIQYHPDVHFVSTTHRTTKASFPDSDRKKFTEHMKLAENQARELEPFHGNFNQHQAHLSTYINTNVRLGTPNTAKGYIEHLESRKQKELAAIKNPLTRNKKEASWNSLISHAGTIGTHLDKLFMHHKTIQDAKNILVHAMDTHSEYTHHIGNKQTGPEGYVIRHVRGNSQFKANLRHMFNRENFSRGTKNDRFS